MRLWSRQRDPILFGSRRHWRKKLCFVRPHVFNKSLRSLHASDDLYILKANQITLCLQNKN
uniref:Uncharacterized protein n=1 Tax=Arundo donax TaxID=35708 RepID=A0A0A9HC93_ARUDO